MKSTRQRDETEETKETNRDEERAAGCSNATGGKPMCAISGGGREREMRRASWSFIAAAAEGWQGGQGIRRWRRGSAFCNQNWWLDRPCASFPASRLRRFFLSRAFVLMILGMDMVAATEQTHESLLSSVANGLHRSAAGRHACGVRASNGGRYAAALLFFFSWICLLGVFRFGIYLHAYGGVCMFVYIRS